MKIDRLIGITMYLLNRNIVSARELADKFEVSVRTIVRDVEALSMAGIPISSSTGASGGYEILDTFKLNKQITNMDDYLFIITALKGMCSAYDNKKLETTLEKLLAAYEHKNNNQRVFLDFGVVKEGENIPEYIQVFEDAISAEYMVEFDYTDSENKPPDYRAIGFGLQMVCVVSVRLLHLQKRLPPFQVKPYQQYIHGKNIIHT